MASQIAAASSAAKQGSKSVSSAALKTSLLLPKTTFPMRANAATRELQHVDRLTNHLYRRQRQNAKQEEHFVLHDGPPYANGALHIGHFLNKVLKDIVNREAMIFRGRPVHFVPGWDCHGLPIELKALQAIKANADASTAASTTMKPLEIRSLARSFAEEAIAYQAVDFKRWGILADWSGVEKRAEKTTGGHGGVPRGSSSVYVTMDPAYEAAQLRVFSKLFERGFVHRALKPVFWSPSSGTALAEAELEYAEAHTSKSAYVMFKFHSASTSSTASSVLAKVSAESSTGLAALVWTTTPWTLPANVALAVHPDLQYSVVKVTKEGSAAADGVRPFPVLLVQSDRLADLQRIVSLPPASPAKGQPAQQSSPMPSASLEVLAILKGSDLNGCIFLHPMSSRLPPVPELAIPAGSTSLRASPVVTAGYVTADSGTGIVHTAPGHGHDDFACCSSYNQSSANKAPSSTSLLPHQLPILCPVDGNGLFNADAGEALKGLPVLEKGNGVVLAQLKEDGSLLHVENYKHRYPYDWRTKKPVIIRATQQWFIRLGQGLADDCKKALNGIDGSSGSGVSMYPPQSRNRFESMIGSRSEWCISRQRTWGLPIPSFFDADTGEPIMTKETIAHLAKVFAEKGSDAWWQMKATELLPEGMRDGFVDAEELDGSPAVAATTDGKRRIVKGKDTLDVWFDSGSSWAAAWANEQLHSNPLQSLDELPLGRVSDAVLEGSDQHRGWFQSSLINSVASTGSAPYKEIITHGFVLDEQGRKMSKSIGNVIAPKDIIDGVTAQAAGSSTSDAAAKGTASGAPVKGKQAKGSSTGGAFAHGHGVDVLRYWVATCDYSKDAVIGPGIISTVTESVRKIRNTARFLLGNLHDYHHLQQQQASGSTEITPEQAIKLWSSPPFSPSRPLGDVHLGVLERCMLHRLASFNESIEASYKKREFHQVVASINAFVSQDLSSQYFDFCKDRLYADLPATAATSAEAASLSRKRKASQVVLWEALRQLTRAIAPIMPFTAEEIFQHSLNDATSAASDGHQQQERDVVLADTTLFDCRLPAPPSGSSSSEWKSDKLGATWSTLLALRAEVNRCLEAARVAKKIGSSLEAAVKLRVSPSGELEGLLSEMKANGELEDLFLTSAVEIEVATLAAEKPTDAPALVDKDGGGFSCSLSSVVPVYLPASTAGEGGNEALSIEVVPAAGKKCVRCWKVKPEVTADAPASSPSGGDDGNSKKAAKKGGKSAEPAPPAEATATPPAPPLSSGHLCERCNHVADAAGLWGQ
jgi:isoleucyl-tRNA synthetase